MSMVEKLLEVAERADFDPLDRDSLRAVVLAILTAMRNLDEGTIKAMADVPILDAWGTGRIAHGIPTKTYVDVQSIPDLMGACIDHILAESVKS